VKILVEEGGADINVRDRWSKTPLDEAVRVGATPVVDFLRSTQARIAAKATEQIAQQL
jgi:ankyrin repeat protein